MFECCRMRTRQSETDEGGNNMGIAGLLPALKSVMDQVHIAKYAGKTVGIDASGWLYKGAYSCPMDVVLRNEDADGCGCCSV